jgi:hypothetical protein
MGDGRIFRMRRGGRNGSLRKEGCIMQISATSIWISTVRFNPPFGPRHLSQAVMQLFWCIVTDNHTCKLTEFTLRLPGFNINALHYIDEKTHSLRYVLKSRTSGEVYLVVLFTLVHASDGHDDESTESKENGSRFEWEAEPSADDVE